MGSLWAKKVVPFPHTGGGSIHPALSLWLTDCPVIRACAFPRKLFCLSLAVQEELRIDNEESKIEERKRFISVRQTLASLLSIVHYQLSIQTAPPADRIRALALTGLQTLGLPSLSTE
jgi:hypothetical protein